MADRMSKGCRGRLLGHDLFNCEYRRSDWAFEPELVPSRDQSCVRVEQASNSRLGTVLFRLIRDPSLLGMLARPLLA